MSYLGVDVHKRESHVAVLDNDGEVDREIRVENANLDEVAEEYAGAKTVIEATSYYTIYDTLDEHLDVVIADPQQTKTIGIAEVENDWLGEVARATSPSRHDRSESRPLGETP